MKSKLERTWWFALPVGVLAGFLTIVLLTRSGITNPYTNPQWILFAITFAGLQRALSFMGWLFVCCFSPAGNVVERTR